MKNVRQTRLREILFICLLVFSGVVSLLAVQSYFQGPSSLGLTYLLIDLSVAGFVAASYFAKKASPQTSKLIRIAFVIAGVLALPYIVFLMSAIDSVFTLFLFFLVPSWLFQIYASLLIVAIAIVAAFLHGFQTGKVFGIIVGICYTVIMLALQYLFTF